MEGDVRTFQEDQARLRGPGVEGYRSLRGTRGLAQDLHPLVRGARGHGNRRMEGS